MVNKFKFSPLIILLLLFISSCAVIDYDEMTYHVPRESSILGVLDKGEIKVGGAAMFGKSNENFFSSQGVEKIVARENYISLRAAYCFANHFAVQSNLFWDHQKNPYDNRRLFQQSVSIGGFYNIEKYKHKFLKDSTKRIRKKNLIFDAYAGMSYGTVRHDFLRNPGYGELNLNYFKGFVHTGLAYNWGRFTEVSLSARVVYTNYIKLNQMNDIPSLETFELGIIKESNSFVHIELAPKFSFGNEYATSYISLSSVTSNDIGRPNPPGRKETVFLGMDFNINKISDWMQNRKKKKADLGFL